ncbi:hypothetical protein PENTCL1PPCAC_11502 [Pristionchus entomophagus]|uniref:Tyrosine specific protein phosphatases domain-containing protein n=1 Tax=Pristionchus entomophagus TaxID=358040 RepID=A0AAV5T480_9BILA|nr:hypothetical protein PENTCL1PPCAC_11502 [Pristionchus entomophagus]
MVRTNRVVPKEWDKYSPLGTVIPRTRFIIFKTPLNESLNNRIPAGSEFTVSHLLRMMAERNQRLGIVVDLTDTNRYYDKRDIEGMCIEYEKLYCPGRGFIERDDIVESFNRAIQKFIEKNDDKEALIGIHCTRGVNRSGYLVCRFLIDCLGWSSHEAIEAFEKARGHGIGKGTYVTALHKAAKEMRDKPSREVMDSDSGESIDEARKKRKRKRREEGGGNEMGNMIKNFLGQLGQEASQLEELSSMMENSGGTPVMNWERREDERGEEREGDDDDEEGEDEGETSGIGGIVDGYEGPNDESAAQKRRARRKRLEKMFNVMKRGRFHEIQAIRRDMGGE